MPPRHIGKVRIDRIIGKGAYARVYAGRMTGAGGFEREVAIKILDARRLTRDPKLIAALADEAHRLISSSMNEGGFAVPNLPFSGCLAMIFAIEAVSRGAGPMSVAS